MRYDVRNIGTYDSECGIATFGKHHLEAFKDFTAEIGAVRATAIDDKETEHSYPPVDLTIDKFDPRSWRRMTAIMKTMALETEAPTVFDLQHEFGLDPADEDGKGKGYGMGRNYVNMAREFSYEGFLTVAHLHTILKNPSQHQLEVIQDLGKFCDALIIPTGTGMDILRNDPYNIEPSKLRRIDHGVRMRDPSKNDRLVEKRKLGLEGIFTVTTLGLKHVDKGINFGIEGYGRFVNESLTPEQREKTIYLILGKWHPNFVKVDSNGYTEAVKDIEGALGRTNMVSRTLHNFDDLNKIDLKKFDVVFVESFMNEYQWNKAYAITNVGVLPYLGMEQISSGILADYVGAGRFSIATKFSHAIDLINPSDPHKEGVIIDEGARGILIDPRDSEQIAQALDYAVFNDDARRLVEKRAFLRGQLMSQRRATEQFVHLIKSLELEKSRKTGRGVKFVREKKSKYSTIQTQ